MCATVLVVAARRYVCSSWLGVCWVGAQVMLDDTLEIVLNGRLPVLDLFVNNRVRCAVFLLGQGVPRATTLGTTLRGTLQTRSLRTALFLPWRCHCHADHRVCFFCCVC